MSGTSRRRPMNCASARPGGFVFGSTADAACVPQCRGQRRGIVGTLTPGHFAQYFRGLALIIDATGEPPAKEQWAELYARYDTTFAV